MKYNLGTSAARRRHDQSQKSLKTNQVFVNISSKFDPLWRVKRVEKRFHCAKNLQKISFKLKSMSEVNEFFLYMN